jgi:hypothetical protein
VCLHPYEEQEASRGHALTKPLQLASLCDVVTPPLSFQIDVAGVHTYPSPKAGFFNLNGSMASACPAGMQVPSRDVCLVGCLDEACIGDNRCSEAYTSKPPLFRCSSCAKGFYNNGCVACACAARAQCAPYAPDALASTTGFCLRKCEK